MIKFNECKECKVETSIGDYEIMFGAIQTYDPESDMMHAVDYDSYYYCKKCWKEITKKLKINDNRL